MWSVVYTRPCSLHAYSTWACIDWLLDDSLERLLDVGSQSQSVRKLPQKEISRYH